MNTLSYITNTYPSPVLYLNQPAIAPSRFLPSKGSLRVEFDALKGLLMIKGDSTKENATPLFNSLCAQIEEYLVSNDQFTCYFHLTNFDLATSAGLDNLYTILAEAQNEGKKIKVNWFATGENMVGILKAGMALEDIHNVKTVVVPV